MSSGLCTGCNRITNSATSDWWFTKRFIPTKCYVAWENNIAVKGCAFDELPPISQKQYQDTIDGWNKNSKKTVEEHIKDMTEGD